MIKIFNLTLAVQAPGIIEALNINSKVTLLNTAHISLLFYPQCGCENGIERKVYPDI